MPKSAPKPLKLEENERKELQELVNRHKTPQQVALRASIILLADEGSNHQEISHKLGISRDMARLWRNRWLELKQKEVPVWERLQDAERCGAPAKFSLEQVLQLFAMACEKPERYERPISEWTARELADVSLDEMTGIQALERKAPDLPMSHGKIERQEFEYIRHGTQTLIASFDVASGKVIQSTVGDTRTEADYLAHVQQTIATDPNTTKWHLIMDCLNTHQSESL